MEPHEGQNDVVGQFSEDGLLKWDGSNWMPVTIEDWIASPSGAAQAQALRTGDMIMFTFNPPTMVPDLQAPIPLSATGFRDNPGALPLCVQGDELPPQLRGPLPYLEPPFMSPGIGQVTIPMVPPDNATPLHQIGGRPVLVCGAPFQVMFQVVVPATQPGETGEHIPDPVMIKFGTAHFIIQNFGAYS